MCRIFKELFANYGGKISIWSITKFISILCYIPFVAMTEVKTFFCKSSHGFHTLLLVILAPFLLGSSSSRAVMFWGCRWATRTFNSLQRFSMGFEIWRLASHSRTLKCFLRSHSFVCPGWCVLGSLSCWKTQPRFIFNALLMEGGFHSNLTIHGPIHSFLYTDQSSWSLCRKTAPKHDVSTPMLHSRYGVLWMQLSILSPPNTSWVFTKKFYFGFIWPYGILPILFWIIQMLSSKLQTGLDMYWLKQGDTSGTAGFESLAAQCVTDGSLCYFGPSSLQVIH